MRQNPSQFPPRTAPETDLQETIVGAALLVVLFGLLFTALLVPAVGVTAIGLLALAVMVRVGYRRLSVVRAARRSRRVALARRRSRSGQ